MPDATTELKTVVVAGNPNAGKTTLFNALAGTRHKVANYPGVTVERVESVVSLADGRQIRLIDLPGCYSLTARSLEEQIAHDVLLGRIDEIPRPSLIVDVIDASNLERNLYLATQLADGPTPLIVVLNMMDVAEEKGIRVDPQDLSRVLGCPVVSAVARKGEGVEEIRSAIREALDSEDCRRAAAVRPFIEELPRPIAVPVDRLTENLRKSGEWENSDGVRAEALWALLANLDGDDPVRLPPLEEKLTRETLRDLGLTSAQLRKVESEARYAYIGRILGEAGVRIEERPHTLTERLDSVFLHRFFGPVLLFLVFALIFQSIFAWAGPAMDAVDGAVAWLGNGIKKTLPDSLFKNMLLDGVLAGVGNTVIFLPQILILFFFLGILEDSGYLARAAFLLDRLMSAIGLSGKAFVPMLSSFACAVPGIMATRTVPNRKDRLVTILIAPLMACSARIPVYILIIGTVFEADRKVFGFLNLGGVVMLGLYLTGIVSAVAVAWVFKRTLLRSPKPVLVLELPAYTLPTPRSILFLLWDRSLIFLKRVGTVILSITILLWGLLNFPNDKDLMRKFDQRKRDIEQRSDLSEEARKEQLEKLSLEQAEAIIQNSFGGRLGVLIEPVIRPLGFDWKIGIGIISSLAAREVFVGTMGVIYGVSTEEEQGTLSLRNRLRAEVRPETGLPFYTPLLGLSLLIFYVYACQCMSTIAIVRRETLSWKWPAFLFMYMTSLAWVSSFLVYQGGRLLGFQ